MSNIIDYMSWRGDVTLAGSPFNEIDNIILAMSTFVDFTDIVPPEITADGIAFTDAMAAFEKVADSRNYLGVLIPAKLLDIARQAVKCPRFADCRLTGFINEVDEERQMQFSALTFLLSDGSVFAAFRGTDDTVVGWKEDIRLGSKEPAPAQKRAVEYLTAVADIFTGGIRLGGHSKGGNVSMWAAAYCPPRVQDRIIGVYNNDGPGFYPEIIASEEFRAVSDRIITFIPQSSIVGVLFDQSPRYHIIKSTQAGILQHDPLSWEVMGTRFVYLEKRSKFGAQSDETLKNWVYSMSEEEMNRFSEILFSIIESTGAKTLTDLDGAKMKNFGIVMKALRSLDKDSRTMMSRLLSRLLGGGKAVQKSLPSGTK